MVNRALHIVLLWLLALLACGCVDELGPQQGDTGFKLTVRCDEPVMTRADDPVHKDGVKSFNENLILSVDLFFYPGASPDEDTPAVYHIRKERSRTEATEADDWEITLRMKKDLIEDIFPNGNGSQATVYALVNFDADFIGNLSETSRTQLAQKRIVTDFAQTESSYIQPSFLMDGSAVLTLTYNEEKPNVTGPDIEVKRFAAKLTMGIHVAPQVVLKHQEATEPGKTTPPDETWEPVLRTMRLYLVDGVKSVLLSADGLDPNPDYFSYRDDANKRPFLNNDGTPCLSTETLNEVEYYQTWPLYSYPRQWDKTHPDYSLTDYTQSKQPTEAPYFKLELDWRRVEDDNYSYEQRKYYYKVFIPYEEFKRNSWYGFYLNVAILGTETDEGKTVLEPSCFLLDWQNKSLAINKAAVISKARYISVERSQWEINNLNTLAVPFLSSHDVVVVGQYDPERKPKATRPYYGEITTAHPVNSYHKDFHAWIRDDGKGGYLLDYTDQPSIEDGGDENSYKYEPSYWLNNTSTSIVLNHALENRYDVAGVKDFDYSPYTIEFDIVHDDLEKFPNSITYKQYIRHITITQFPGIYIECLHNRDQEIKQIGTNGGGYPNHPSDKPWLNYPWGYVYVNGGRFIRQDPGDKDPYFKLSKDKYKKEYQWQAVYYTGGSKDIYDIHVTVLPSSSSFVIGDPRVDAQANDAEGTGYLKDENEYPNLYKFTVEAGDDADLAILRGNFQYQLSGSPYDNRTRTGFNVANALYESSPRSLQWYYPTDKGSRTVNMLAPSYRISTKLGGTEFGNISKELAEYRCAGYQEDGLPAGRWRLPTKAEVSFVAQLSAKKFFIHIFTKGTGTATYWSASNAITVNADTGKVTDSKDQTALLRCVYDSWYWDEIDRREGLKETGDDPRFDPPTMFYWGDKQR